MPIPVWPLNQLIRHLSPLQPEDGGPEILISPTTSAVALFKIYPNGLREQVPLVLDEELEKVLKSEARGKPIQLLYQLWELQKEFTKMELHNADLQPVEHDAKAGATQQVPEKPLLEQLHEAGIHINSIFQETKMKRKEKKQYLKKKRRRTPFTQRYGLHAGRNAAVGLVTGLALAGVIAPLAVGTEPVPANPTQSTHAYIGPGDISGKIGFIEQDTTNKTIWDISYHGVEPESYYVTDIASVFANNSWQHSLGDSGIPIHLPKSPDSQYYTELTGIASTASSRVFNLPESLATRVDSLRVTDTKGKEVPIVAFQNDDGLVTVAVPGRTAETLLVQETLVATDTVADMPHAVEPIAKIDVKKLSSVARRKLVKKHYGEVFDAFSKDTYSINPPDAALLHHTDGSAESFINAAVRLSGSDCAIANTELALVSSLYSDPFFLNEAIGFIAQANDPQGTTARLDSLHSHEFTLTAFGTGPLDVTPATPGKDTSTQMYLHALNKDTQKGASIQDQWQTYVSAEKAYEKEEKAHAEQLVALEAIMGLALLGGVSLGGVKGARVLRPYITADSIAKVRETMSFWLGSIDEKALAQAYDILPWISHGNTQGQHTVPSAMTVFASDHEGLSKIRSNTTHAGLEEYRRNHKHYAETLGLTKSERKKLRTIARMAK